MTRYHVTAQYAMPGRPFQGHPIYFLGRGDRNSPGHNYVIMFKERDHSLYYSQLREMNNLAEYIICDI